MVRAFQRLLERQVELTRREEPHISPVITGYLERFLFAVLIGVDVSGVPPAMMAWIGIKMVAHWQSPERKQLTEDPHEMINRRFAALLTGMMSLTVAVAGGLICRGTIPVSPTLLVISAALVVLSAAAQYFLQRPKSLPNKQVVPQ